MAQGKVTRSAAMTVRGLVANQHGASSSDDITLRTGDEYRGYRDGSYYLIWEEGPYEWTYEAVDGLPMGVWVEAVSHCVLAVHKAVSN